MVVRRVMLDAPWSSRGWGRVGLEERDGIECLSRLKPRQHLLPALERCPVNFDISFDDEIRRLAKLTLEYDHRLGGIRARHDDVGDAG